MHKSFFFLPCCFLLSSLISSSVLAQTSTQNQSKIIFQNNQAQFQIKSKNTGHDYLIQIYKPPVAPPQHGYPVLYILDGNATFPSAANIAQSIGAGSAKLGLDPLMIVAVGYPQQKLLMCKNALMITHQNLLLNFRHKVNINMAVLTNSSIFK